MAGKTMTYCGQAAAYVVRDLGGMEWFVCEAHGAATSPRWIVRTPIADWFRARSIPVPRDGARVCNEAPDLAKAAPASE